VASTVYSFAEGDLKLRYREPYLSQSLNTKFQSIVTAGIYDGFNPVVGSGAQTLALQAGDYGHVAVATSTLDASYQVSVHLPTIPSISLSAHAGQTVLVALIASYNFPSVTSAQIVLYDLSVDAVPPNAVRICEVVVPTTAVSLTAADITLKGRTLPWETRGRDAVPMVDIVKNGTFHFFKNGQTNDLPAPYWNLTAGTGSFAVVNASGPDGVNDNVLVATAATGANTVKVAQPATISVTPSSMRVQVFAQYQQVVALTSGSAAIKVYFRNANDPTSITDTVTLPLVMPSGGTLGTWYDLEMFVTVDASTTPYAKYLSSVEIDLNASEFASTGTAFRLTNVSVSVEQGTKATDLLLENTTDVRATSLRIVDIAETGPNAGYAKAIYTRSTNVLALTNEAAGAIRVVLTGRFDSGSVYTPVIDYAGALSIGATEATTVSISRTGQITAILGSATVATNLGVTGATSTGTLTVSGATTLTGGVLAPSLDTATAVPLTIGITTQTGLTVGRIGAPTVVRGATAAFAGDSTTSIGLLSASGTTSIYGPTINLDSGAGNITALSAFVASAGVTTSTLNGDSNPLAIGDSASTTSLSIGRVGADTVLFGSSIGIGTNISDGPVTIGSTAQITTVAGNLSVTGISTVSTLKTSSLQGNTGALLVGTNSTLTSSLTLGSGTVPVTVNGGVLNVIGATTTLYGTTSTTVGTTSAPTTIAGSTIALTSAVPSGAIYLSGIDTQTAGPLVIGTGNSNGITIGSVSAATVVAGAFNVLSASTINAAFTFANGVTVAAGNLSLGAGTVLNADVTNNLYAQNIDRANSGTPLSIGTTNASTITIGRAGQTLTVLSSTALAAVTAQTATFNGTVTCNGTVDINSTLEAAVVQAGTTTTGTLYVGSTNTVENKVVSAPFAHASTAATSSATITTTDGKLPLNVSEFARTLTVDTPNDIVKNFQAGFYQVNFTLTGYITGVTVSPGILYVSIGTTSVSAYFPTNSSVNISGPRSSGIFANFDPVSLSGTFLVHYTASGSTQDLFLQARVNAGSFVLEINSLSLTVHRIAPST
jgi:hypothetical protein